MTEEDKKALQIIKNKLTVLLKDFNRLEKVKLNFKNGDNIHIENQEYVITLDSNNNFGLSENKK